MIRRLIIILFHTLLLILPLFFTTVNDELFEFNKIILVYIFTALIVGLWIMRMIADNMVYWKRTPFDIPIGLFVLSQIISTFASIHPHTSWLGYYSRFNGGLLSLLCYVALFYAFINTFEKKDLRDFLSTTLYAGSVAAFYAFLEHFGHSPSCLFITGNFDVSCWIQDVKTRVFGTFGQPNWLAAYLILLIPLWVAQLIESWFARRTWASAWNGIMLALSMATLLFTQSRSGLLGLGLGGVMFAAVVIWHAVIYGSQTHENDGKHGAAAHSLKPLTKKEHKKLAQLAQHKRALTLSVRTIIAPALVVLGIMGGLILTFGTPITPSLFTFVAQLKQTPQPTQTPENTSAPQTNGGTQLEVGGTESGTIRAIVWKGSLAVWKRYPVFGSGVETFAYSYYQDRPIEHNLVSEWDFLYNKAHNEFLNYLATTGTVGFLTYVVMIGWVLWWLILHSKTNPLFFGALIAGYSALHISNFFGFSTVVVSLLFYLIPAFGMVENSPSDVLPKSGVSLGVNQWIGLGITACVSLYAVSIPVNMWRSDAQYSEAKRLITTGKGELALARIQDAITISPVPQGEFHEELGRITSELSVAAYKQQQATMSADYGEMAIRATDDMLRLNPRHLNFYKSRARVLLTLSQIAPDLMKEVLSVLNKAQEYAPTDAKLVYNRALILEQLSNRDQALTLMKQAVEMKANYTGALDQLKRMEGTFTPAK